MDQRLEEHFCSQYPEIFPPHDSRRALHFRMECGDGWFELLDATCQLIQQQRQDESTSSTIATQIKEKFGTLRFYYRGGDTYIDRVIDLSEHLSGSICEICGKSGKTLETARWLRTRCPVHSVEPNRQNATSSVSATPSSSKPLAEVLAAALHFFDFDAVAAAQWLTTTNNTLLQSPLTEAVSAGNYLRVVTLISQIEHREGR